MIKADTNGLSFHSVFMAGNIFLASIDVTSLLEYGLRIALGTAVISASKYIGERWQRRRRTKAAQARLNRIRSRKSKRDNNGIR